VSGSDRHASRWQQALRIPGAEELTLDHAYRAMVPHGRAVAPRKCVQHPTSAELPAECPTEAGTIQLAR
jgi:hypothetical protein